MSRSSGIESTIAARLAELSFPINGNTVSNAQPGSTVFTFPDFSKIGKLVRSVKASELFAIMTFIEFYILPKLGTIGGTIVYVEPTALESYAEHVAVLSVLYPSINFYLYDTSEVVVSDEQREQLSFVRYKGAVFTKLNSNVFFARKPFTKEVAQLWAGEGVFLVDRRNPFLYPSSQQIEALLEEQANIYRALSPKAAMYYMRPNFSEELSFSKGFSFLKGTLFWSLFDGTDLSQRLVVEGEVETVKYLPENFIQNYWQRVEKYDKGSSYFDKEGEFKRSVAKENDKQKAITKPLDSDPLFKDNFDTYIAQAIFMVYRVRNGLLDEIDQWRTFYNWRMRYAAYIDV